MPTTILVRVDIRQDENEYGEQAYLVTPVYNRLGRIMTVPDTRGWPTRDQAQAEADEIWRRNANKHR